MAQIESLKTEQKFKRTEAGEIPVEWEAVNLGDIARINMGQSPPSSTCFDYENGLPFFQGKAEFGTKYPGIMKWSNCPTKIAKKGDILISVRAPAGEVNIAPEKCCIGRGLSAIRGDQAHQDFLYFVMNFLKDKLAKTGQGSTFEAINKDVLFKLKIPLPPFIEQKKITEILLTVDSAIERKSQFIEKKRELKKGLMQELLSCGIGHKKFYKTTIGEIPVEWEIGQLKKIGKIIAGSTPGTKIKEYFNGEYMFVTPFDMGDFKYVKKTARMLSEEGMSVSRRLPKDTVMVTCIASIGKIGMASEECSANQQINSIICNNNVDARFIYYMMLYKVNFLKTLAGQTAVPIIKKSLFENVFIPLPPFHEQKRIAEIISSIDEEIEREIQEELKLEQLKKGLMQALLTGKIKTMAGEKFNEDSLSG